MNPSFKRPARRLLLSILLFIHILPVAHGQRTAMKALEQDIDNFLNTPAGTHFSGVIMIAQKGKVRYKSVKGFSDQEQKKPFSLQSPFLLGSVSKQITAVLVLREYDQQRLDLNAPLKRYLPDLQQSWADSITLHQLLNHSSGVVSLDKPLAFAPGTQFQYSPYLAYHLLSRVIETTSGKSYDVLVEDLFRICKMKHSAYPYGTTRKNQAAGYSKNADGKPEKNTLDYKTIRPIVAGGALVSTPLDLVQWNEQLHGGKLLSPASYERMTSHQITRDHSIWGITGYGYGIQTNRNDGIAELGHSGYCEGFNSINFYYPETQTSLIILSNTDWYPEDIVRTFVPHRQIRAILRDSELLRPAK